MKKRGMPKGVGNYFGAKSRRSEALVSAAAERRQAGRGRRGKIIAKPLCGGLAG